MLYFISSLLCSVGILTVFKIIHGYKLDNLSVIVVNYLICVALSLCFALPFSYDEHTKSWIFWAIALGFTFFYGFRFFAISSQKAGIAITSVAANISLVIPVSLGFFLYNEPIKVGILLGIFIAIISFFLIFKSKDKSQTGQSTWIYPLLIFIFNGANNSMTKHGEHLGATLQPYAFVGLTFFIALMLSSSLLFKKSITNPFNKSVIIAGTTLGLLNFFSSYFFLIALSKFNSTTFFPTYNLSYIVLAALIGLVIFKERLRWINYVGIGVALIAILFITEIIWIP